MEKILDKKVIVISGGTKGIGRAVAIEAAKQGAKVVIGGRDKQAAEKIQGVIGKEDGDSYFVYTDLTDVKACKELFDKAYEKYGKINGYMNYAGLTYAGSLLEADEDNFDSIFEVNIKGAFFCAQNAIKYMKKNGGGSIVMMGSPHAWGGEKDRAAYACSKGALLTLTEHIAHHYGEDLIRANYVTMGWTPTDGEIALRESQGMSVEELRTLAAGFIPMGRMQEIEDHVPGILYLLSDYSQMVSGANLRVTGGWYI